ncbi:hypothetical protein [Larsenimonas suaedae]|uniref:Uncharacterized protein n=1 Tax=Larsenimonas suaedae TaxID=1851019 RepID=A0ABU1GUS7_9GAMM|nr:hypothetical protein [Larsenimonas suaedae]MCM2971095.1 hypothetical protein [Larsenimonas suaedae]MDR5895804.1 hypothetical protein [Larsenimonas suaedae]
MRLIAALLTGLALSGLALFAFELLDHRQTEHHLSGVKQGLAYRVSYTLPDERNQAFVDAMVKRPITPLFLQRFSSTPSSCQPDVSSASFEHARLLNTPLDAVLSRVTPSTAEDGICVCDRLRAWQDAVSDELASRGGRLEWLEVQGLITRPLATERHAPLTCSMPAL